ncbi:DoxX family protein [Terriglobus roseus]|nr:DoxX family membrane protein [Terriglobus roseus]
MASKQLRMIGLVAQSLLYVAAGVNHFWHSGTYVAIMPPHYSDPLLLVQVSGAAEILGGIGLLVPATRRFAAWGILAMLVVYFDVHFYMAMHPERFAAVPVWALYGRIPLQLVLIAWAWVYARPERSRG